MPLIWHVKLRHSYAFWHAQVEELRQGSGTRMENAWMRQCQSVKEMPMTSSKAPLGDGALPELITGAAGSADAVAAWDYTAILPQSGCHRCAWRAPHCANPHMPPHYQRMVCGQCGRWLRWLPRPRPVAQEGRA